MMQVLQVFGALVLGGAESRMMDIYREIDRNEFDFDFVSMKLEKQFFEDEITSLGGTIYKIGFPREVGTIKNIKQLRECIRAKKYDAVHAHTSYHSGIVMLAAWLEHVPVRIVHARTNGSRQKNFVKLLPLIFGRLLIKLFATKKVAISNEAGKYLFGKSKFEVIPNAINTKLYQCTDEQEIASLKESLNVPQTAKVIGHIGRFDEMKNHKFAVDCFAEFLKKNPDSVMFFVGKGDLLEKTKAYVNEKGIIGNVKFLGERSDVPKLIHIFDVLLFPSKFEGLGGVAIEAQAAGVPVVESTNVPGETDLGLGMVQRLSLDVEPTKWALAIEKAVSEKRTDYEDIRKAFENRGYDISVVTKTFENIYKGNA